LPQGVREVEGTLVHLEDQVVAGWLWRQEGLVEEGHQEDVTQEDLEEEDDSFRCFVEHSSTGRVVPVWPESI
jgi:hypothetical protein